MSQPDLSVIIPTWNDAGTVVALVDTLLGVHEADVEVIVVDDASTDDTVARLHQVGSPRLTVLEQPVNRGAGVARNTGFPRAQGRYTLFFDADDEIHGDALVSAVRGLDETEADVAMLAYDSLRGSATEVQPMPGLDAEVWQQSVHGDRTLTTLGDVPRVLGMSNYPWNKVIRTPVYRDIGLRFGSTPVNNDILGHWQTLLFSHRLLLIDQVLCTHIVAAGGKNLTNQHSRVRLSLFDALDETYAMLSRRPDLRARYAHHYWDFVLRVSGWAAGRISADLMPEFTQRLQDHLLRIDLADFHRIRTRRSPGLGERIVRRALS